MVITQEGAKNTILDEIGVALDITEAQYKLVEDRYLKKQSKFLIIKFF